ncbi:MAG: TetR/AcrR family transcriptional regulator [Spirochaetaceae bacterium]|nr:TetR/AcrR family transcriptional regulator [Spirochaetaceae bacterium]
MKKKTQQAERAHVALKEAFLQIYKDNEIQNISVSHIAQRAGYSRGTFYRHFDSPYDILAEIENDIIRHLNALIFSLLKEHTPSKNLAFPSQQLEPFWNQFIKYMQENEKLLYVMFSAHLPETLVEKIKSMVSGFFYFFIPPQLKSRPETDFLVAGLTAMEVELFLRYFSDPQKISFDKLIKLVYSFAEISSILTTKIFGGIGDWGELPSGEN